MFFTSVFVPSVVTPCRSHRHVGVAAQAALLHVPVVHAERDEHLAQHAKGIGRVAGRPQVGFGHDLNQWRTAAIEIEVGLPFGIRKALVQRFPGVFLHVHARDAHALGRAGRRELESARCRQRQLVLRDLITLRQIRIEVVLASEDRLFVDDAVERQGGLGGKIDRPAVQHRQSPRKPETNRANAGIRRMAESRAAAAENLGVCQEPGVYFEPNDGFKSHEV